MKIIGRNVKLHTTNREAAERFDWPLARWKRWTREFLPPDPEAGMRKGIKREIWVNDAFHVFLGGVLVNELNFGISQAKTIIRDIWPKLSERHFLPATALKMYPDLIEFVIHPEGSGFRYELREIMQELPQGNSKLRRVVYECESFRTRDDDDSSKPSPVGRIVNLTYWLEFFINRMSV